MDSESVDDSMISRKSWPVVLWLSGFLNPAEREAVLGDLIEYGESCGGAIANILGLVVQRRAAVFLDLRLWFAVALVVLPISYLLSAVAQATAGEGAVYSWMYLNNWDWALTRNSGFWYVLRETAVNFGTACVVLACWSWSGGFLIGRLPNKILRASRNAFVVLLLASFIADLPGRLIQFWMFLHRLPLRSPFPDPNAPVTANVFYHVFFPWIIIVILVVLPAFSGMQHGTRSLLLGRDMQVVLAVAATISLTILLMQTPGFELLSDAAVRTWLWRNRNAMQMLSMLCYWPMIYSIAIGFGRYRKGTAAMAQ